MPQFLPRLLEGWGRFPVEECRVTRPEKRRALNDLVSNSEVETLLARGLGRAYGDAALSADQGVVMLEKLDRFLDFDAQSGVLECEGGTSLSQIIGTFVPRGWFLPVVPGTKFVTVGGAIACDVHGKNHHRVGCFSRFVREFDLLLASGETLTCSPQHNAEAFRATIGGLGLTGIITRATIELRPIETAYIKSSLKRTANLEETLEEFGRDAHTTYSVAWIDCLASGDALGRSVVIRGEHATKQQAQSAGIQGGPLDFELARAKPIPRDFPSFALNPLSVKAFNALYYANHTDSMPLVGFEPFFWPLDKIGGWNKIYGARGFIQYHCILPFSSSKQGLTRMLKHISSSNRPAFLAVLKHYGPENESPLSFPLAGHSLALDLPASEGAVEFARELDALVLEGGGRCYLAKDSTMTPDSFRQMYPRFSEFARIKAELDPKNRFQSSLSRRLQIVGGAV